jgi:hypothetical protein
VLSPEGPALELTGPHASTLAAIASAAASPGVPRPLGTLPATPRSWPEFDDADPETCQVVALPGICLARLVSQRGLSTEDEGLGLPLQAAVALAHDAALGLEACRRGLRTLFGSDPGARLEGLSPLSVRVGFRGGVQVFPVPLVPEPYHDGAMVLRFGVTDRSGAELGPPFTPEDVAGYPPDASEDVFFVAQVLLRALGVPSGLGEGQAQIAMLEAMRWPPPPALPPTVSATLAALVLESVGPADRRVPSLGAFCSVLRREVDLVDGRVALAACASARFPIELDAQLAFVEDARSQEVTRPLALPGLVKQVTGSNLFADTSLVTYAQLDDFLRATGHPAPPHFVTQAEVAALPLVFVDHATAAAYCRWRGGRLPTDFEWSRVTAQRWCRDLGRLWEWTADRAPHGHVVRGGPWRNQGGPGLRDHRSWEDAAAPDLGFRCVYDAPPLR